MSRDRLVHYVSHPHNPNVRVGCLVALIGDDHKIHIGWSQCRPDDNFCKREGRVKATYRALYGDKGVKPVPYRFYNPDGSYVKKDTFGASLDIFRLQALQYFSPDLADDRPVADYQILLSVSPDPNITK